MSFWICTRNSNLVLKVWPFERITYFLVVSLYTLMYQHSFFNVSINSFTCHTLVHLICSRYMKFLSFELMWAKISYFVFIYLKANGKARRMFFFIEESSLCWIQGKKGPGLGMCVCVFYYLRKTNKLLCCILLLDLYPIISAKIRL